VYVDNPSQTLVDGENLEPVYVTVHVSRDFALGWDEHLKTFGTSLVSQKLLMYFQQIWI